MVVHAPLARNYDLDTLGLVRGQGNFATEHVTLSGEGLKAGLFPAFTGSSGTVRCNFSARPWRHQPPSPAFTAFADFDSGRVAEQGGAAGAAQAAA